MKSSQSIKEIVLFLCVSTILFLMFSLGKADASKKSGQEILKNLTDPSSITVLNDELRRINDVLINHEARITALE